MRDPDAANWITFLTRLAGRTGRFYAGDPSGSTPRGTATGTPLIAGAGQSGKALLTDGWTAGISPILRAGDYIAWNTPLSWRELHKVTADANSDGSGAVALSITPPIRESPANDATLIVSGATCVMMLATEEDGMWDVDEAGLYEMTFSAEEAVSVSVE